VARVDTRNNFFSWQKK